MLRLPVVVCGVGIAVGYLWWVHSGGPGSVDRANIGAFDAAAVMAVCGLVAWWWAGRSEPTRDSLVDAAEMLAWDTAKQWEREARRWGISVPVKVAWSWDGDRSLSEDQLMTDATTSTLDAKVVGRIHDELYARLDHGQLVILGEAGAGKTAAMVLLLREVLARRRRVPSAEERMLHPVPVWLTLGGWNPARASLVDYAAESLQRAYPALQHAKYGDRAAARLIDEGRVAFFLDGLDEMPEAAQAVALAAIDDQSVLLRVVLTSRLDGYLRAREGGRLTYPAVVQLLAVDVSVAAEYLALGHDRRVTRETFERFAGWLRANEQSPAADALRTPLALTLVRSAYADRADPHELARLANRDEVMQTIIGQFLTMAYPDSRQREVATFWLGWTARQMGPTRDLGWWDVAAWVEPRLIKLSEIGLYAVTIGPISAFVGWYVFGPIVGVLGLLSPLLLVPTAFEQVGPRRTDFQPIALTVQLPTARQTMLVSVVSVIAAGSAGLLAFLSRLVTGPEIFGLHIYPGTVSALTVLVVIGVALVTAIFTTPSADAPAATPASLRRADLRSAGLIMAVGLVFGSVFGALASVLVSTIGAVEAAGLGAGTGVGLALALLGARGAMLPVRSAGRWVSGAFEQPPAKVNFPRLLDDALQRQVLRQAGPIYQFRHAELQDYLREAFVRRRPAGSEAADRVALPPENPMSLVALQQRLEAATARGTAGDPSGALEDLRALLTDQARVLGRGHTDLYDTLAAIAVFQAELGDADAAVRAAEQLVRHARRLTAGTSRLRVLQSRALLARRRTEAGQRSEAIDDYRRLSRDAGRFLGLDHPETLGILDQFSELLADGDEFAEAIAVMTDYVAGCEHAFGPDHAATLTARRRLAYYLANAGRADLAIDLMVELVPRLAAVFGPNADEAFVGRYNLACFRGGNGDRRRAAAELEELAADARQAYGDDAEWVARAEFEAAEQHVAAGQLQVADSLLAHIVARHGEASRLGAAARERLAELHRGPG